MTEFARLIELPPAGTESFFLWGPRQAGKSTLLHECYPDAAWIDLLKSELLRKYAAAPQTLREIAAERPGVKRRLVVSTVADSRTTEDGIEILGVMDFVNMLWDGALF